MESDKLSQDFVVVDFYEGGYGPTLRIDVPSVALFALVMDAFRDLASSKTAMVRFHELSFVKPVQLGSFVLIAESSSKVTFGTRSLEVRRKRKALPEVTWAKHPDAWEETFELLTGLEDGPGHQYLTLEGIDDALVELSFLETNRSTLNLGQ